VFDFEGEEGGGGEGEVSEKKERWKVLGRSRKAFVYQLRVPVLCNCVQMGEKNVCVNLCVCVCVCVCVCMYMYVCAREYLHVCLCVLHKKRRIEAHTKKPASQKSISKKT